MIVTFCNPLLDMTANVDQKFLEKYNLQPNNQILADQSHDLLFQDLVENFRLFYSAGGAGQNTARAIQWMNQPSIYVGCVGRDDYAKELRKQAEADGLTLYYMETDQAPTGTCACLITDKGKNRSLVARLGAANHYSVTHFREHQAIRDAIQNAKVLYFTGFFLTVSPQTMIEAATLAKENGVIVALNLSAPFLSQFFKEQMLQILPFVDLLFGNEGEALSFAQNNGICLSDIPEIAKELSSFDGRKRTVVITQGSNPTVVVQDGRIDQFPVPFVADIVDTNGAGDAFVGGFLSEFSKGSPLKNCVESGHYVASVIIRQSGVVFPQGKPDKY